MPRTKSELDDEIEFLYMLGRGGWSDLYLVVGRRAKHFRITHIVHDPMSDLIELCCSILRGEDGYSLRLHDEPGATLIAVERRKDQRHILAVKVYEAQGWDDVPASGEPVLSFDIKARQFVALFYHQFDKLASLCRENSYAKDRAAFPHAEFQAFKKLWSD